MNESITTAQSLGRSICDVLGLDSNRIGRMTIDLDPGPGKAATIQVVKYLSETEGIEITKAISNYELHAK
jgi:hypothetical protein